MILFKNFMADLIPLYPEDEEIEILLEGDEEILGVLGEFNRYMG